MTADPCRIADVRWVLIADPAAMECAEYAVLGDYANHWSSPEYALSDEPDEPGDLVERTITLQPMRFPADVERMPIFWRIAAEVGEKGHVAVIVEAPAVHVGVNTAGAVNLQYCRVSADLLDADLRARVKKAQDVLRGGGA